MTEWFNKISQILAESEEVLCAGTRVEKSYSVTLSSCFQ